MMTGWKEERTRLQKLNLAYVFYDSSVHDKDLHLYETETNSRLSYYCDGLFQWGIIWVFWIITKRPISIGEY